MPKVRSSVFKIGRKQPAAPPANPCWIDNQCLVIDVSTMLVSHRGELSGFAQHPDDAKVMTFLGAMNNCKVNGRHCPQLDTSKAGIAATGVTSDNKHLRLAIASGIDPASAWLQAYDCWKFATGRSLWLEHGAAPKTESVPER